MKRLKAAFFLGLFTFLVTLCLILIGNLVHNTGSSLACPDWPLCYGELFPKMEGGVLYEHGHRYLGLLVGFCATLLVVLLWPTLGGSGGVFGLKAGLSLVIATCLIGGGFSITDAGLAWLGSISLHAAEYFLVFFLALLFTIYVSCFMFVSFRRILGLAGYALGLLALVCFQGLLGGATVAYRLPTLVSTAHLGTSLLILTGWLFLVVKIRQVDQDRSVVPGASTGAMPLETMILSLVVFAAVFFQALVGALVRHTGVSGAAGLGTEYMLLGFDAATGYPCLWPSTGGARLNMLHRLLAFPVMLIVFVYSGRCWHVIPPYRRRIRMICWIPSLIVIAQVLIGMMMLGMGMPGTMRMAHLMGASMLLSSLALILGVCRHRSG